jgi:hypothetical protein
MITCNSPNIRMKVGMFFVIKSLSLLWCDFAVLGSGEDFFPLPLLNRRSIIPE